MHTIIFIITPSVTESKWLNDKMMQLTKSFISILNKQNKYPVEFIDNHYDINNFLKKAEYLIVASAGNIILDPDHIWNQIHSIPDDIGLLGNLIQHTHDSTPYLHEQFFIIKTSAFTHLSFEQEETIGIELLRSKESMHGDWAPLEITLGNNLVDRSDRFGTKLIEHCLSRNHKVKNYDHNWRYSELGNQYLAGETLPSRPYCYPEKKSKNFEIAMRKLDIVDDLDPAQVTVINLMKKLLNYNVLNTWHYEQSPQYTNIDKIICPATGFLSEIAALNASSSQIIFYDINKNNIEFKKSLYKNWNGKNYDEFVLNWSKDRNIVIEPAFDFERTLSQKFITETETKLFPIWTDWKSKMSFDFIHVDLIKDHDKILSLVSNNTILYTSTILSTFPMSHILYTQQEIDSVREKLKKITNFNNTYWLES